MLKKLFLIVIITFSIGITICQPAFAGTVAPTKIKLQPDQILMGASFNGTQISVLGHVPTDADVLIRLVGHYGATKLKKKGRALGLLWMNMGTVEFRGVPSVFLLLPSDYLEKFSQSNKQKWRKLGLGFEALEEEAEIVPASEDKHRLFQEFRKLKESAGLYGIQKKRIQYGSTNNSMNAFTATVDIPSDIPQGSYKLQVFIIKNGTIISSTEEEIKAEEVGLPATLSFLAFKHSTLYGVLSVVVAILAGLVTGMIFKGAKEGH